jgi:hypothetical protein
MGRAWDVTSAVVSGCVGCALGAWGGVACAGGVVCMGTYVCENVCENV